MANAALVASPLAAGTLLPRDALDRSVPELPLGSAPLRNVLRRLQSGEPLIVTAIGMSNTFEFGGVCAAGPEPAPYDSLQRATRVHTSLPHIRRRTQTGDLRQHPTDYTCAYSSAASVMEIRPVEPLLSGANKKARRALIRRVVGASLS